MKIVTHTNPHYSEYAFRAIDITSDFSQVRNKAKFQRDVAIADKTIEFLDALGQKPYGNVWVDDWAAGRDAWKREGALIDAYVSDVTRIITGQKDDVYIVGDRVWVDTKQHILDKLNKYMDKDSESRNTFRLKADLLRYMDGVADWRNTEENLEAFPVTPSERVFLGSVGKSTREPVLWFLFTLGIETRHAFCYIRLHGWTRSLYNDFSLAADPRAVFKDPQGVGPFGLGLMLHAVRTRLFTDAFFMDRLRPANFPDPEADAATIRDMPFVMFAEMFRTTWKVLRDTFGIDASKQDRDTFEIAEVQRRNDMPDNTSFPEIMAKKAIVERQYGAYVWATDSHVIRLRNDIVDRFAQIAPVEFCIACDDDAPAKLKLQGLDPASFRFCSRECHAYWRRHRCQMKKACE